MAQQWRVEGMVVDAATLRPVAGASVTLIGRSKQAAGMTGVVDDPTEGVEWTRCLTGFAGTRWELWERDVRSVPNLTWAQFQNDVLLYNPQLSQDGRLFKSDKLYLLPEHVAQGRVRVATTTGANGAFQFAAVNGPEQWALQVEMAGFNRWVGPLLVNQELLLPIQLTGRRNMRSLLPAYSTLSPMVRTVVDQALSMLGNDATIYDALPSALQPFTYGHRFRDQPNHVHHKDIVCADLVSVVFQAAGVPIDWVIRQPPGEGDSTHRANHYRPSGTPQLIEINDPNDWRPGDVLCYGRGDFNTTPLKHVNLYVGPFAGVDMNGATYTEAQSNDVVEGSIDFTSNNKVVGTGVVGCTREQCLHGKRGWQWVRRVRHVALA